MYKSINSQPAANLFRIIFTLGLIAILAIVLLTYLEDKEGDIEKIVLEKTVKDVNAVLSIMTYQLIIRNETERLTKLSGENPFEFSEIKKLNIKYGGVGTRGSSKLINKTWYFDTKNNQVIYFSKKFTEDYKLLFDFQDMNGNKKYDKNIDELVGLVLVK